MSMDGGIGQAAGQLLEEMKQAQADLQQKETQKTEGPNEAFKNAMQQAEGVQQTHTPDALRTSQVETASKAQNVLMQARVNASELSSQVGHKRTESTHMAKMLDGLLQGQDKMTQIMDTAMSGQQLSPPELLGMQAAVFRYTQELELVGKVVDKAVSGVKQVLNTQV